MEDYSEILHRFANIPIEEPKNITLAGVGIENVYGMATHTVARHPQTGVKYVCAGNPHPGSVDFEGCAPLTPGGHFVCSRQEALKLQPLAYDPVERFKQPLIGRCAYTMKD